MLETNLRPHQQEFVANHIDKPRVCLYWDCRTGKSKAGELWMKYRTGKQLVICIKKNKAEWQSRLPHATVMTKEEIKKPPLETFDNLSAILMDEVHFLAGSLYIAKLRSAMSERVYNILARNPDVHVIMLSATPVTNAYYSLHTLMTYLNQAPDWHQYQQYMAELVRNPFIKGRRNVKMWLARKDWRQRARKVIEKYHPFFHRVRLEDCVDSLPPVIDEIVMVKGGGECMCTNDEKSLVICHWTHNHKLEQVNKVKWVLDNSFDKLIIACHYREQVDEVAKQLSKHRPVYKVHGGTSKPDTIIKKWQNDPFGYLVISAHMGEGFDGYTADAIVFMSIPHKVLAHTQMKERLTTLDRDKMKPKLYFYLLGGKWDKKIYKTVVKQEKDFYETDS